MLGYSASVQEGLQAPGIGRKYTNFHFRHLFLAELGRFLLNVMAFLVSVDRQSELQLAGSYMQTGHHTAQHFDAQVPFFGWPL